MLLFLSIKLLDSPLVRIEKADLQYRLIVSMPQLELILIDNFFQGFQY